MRPRVEFDLKVLEENIFKMKKEVNNINFLFPIKCCTHNSVLELVYKNNFGFDVSNRNEMTKIEKYLDGRFVSVSGPLSYELEQYNYSNLHIIANNFNSYNTSKGIRINFNANTKFDKSRFGVEYTSIDPEYSDKIHYIHFHNSDHKDAEKCNDIIEEFSKVVNLFPNLKMINLGGHLEDLEFSEGITYLNRIRQMVPNNIELYVELGDFLFKNVGKLYCEVIDIRNDVEKQHITLNFSKMANQRWVYAHYEPNNNNELISTIFYGCSCCETDIYLETKSQILNIHDHLIFSNISPYSYEWDTTFNGVDKMEFLFINK